MERHGDEVDLTTDEARGGSTPHIVRYVLLISLFLAAAAMTIVWVTGALTSDGESTAPVTVDSQAGGEDVAGEFTYEAETQREPVPDVEGMEGLVETPERTTGAD